MSTAVGAGVLALPFTLRVNGFIYGWGVIIFGAILAYWGLEQLTRSSELVGINDFGGLATHEFGKCAGILMHCLFTFLCFNGVIIF